MLLQVKTAEKVGRFSLNFNQLPILIEQVQLTGNIGAIHLQPVGQRGGVAPLRCAAGRGKHSLRVLLHGCKHVLLAASFHIFILRKKFVRMSAKTVRKNTQSFNLLYNLCLMQSEL